jgi:hypothetical protein
MAIAACLILQGGCVTLTSASSVLGAGASMTGAYFDYLTAEKAEGVVIVPPMQEYGTAVQSKAADELDLLKSPCPADIVVPNCSALARMIIDYGVLRDKIRAAADQ